VNASGKELFVRGIPKDLKDKDLIKFFKKNDISVASVDLTNGKS